MNRRACATPRRLCQPLVTRALLLGVRLWTVVMLAGCWSTTPPPVAPVAQPEPQPRIVTRPKPRGPSRCEVAIDHVVTIVQPEIDRNPMTKDKGPLLRDAAVESCLRLGWSDDTLACYDGTVDLASLRPCFQKLTDAQRDDFNQRITDVMSQPTP